MTKMSEYQCACSISELPDGSALAVELGDRMVMLVRCEGQVHCLDDVCTHDGGTLSDGRLIGCEIECPRHGARFDVRTGEALSMPATEDTTCHSVKIEGDSIWVRLGSQAK